MAPVIAIGGATAVGKSTVADRVACELGGEVISADAMQVYCGMDIGTAKTPREERAVPLRMVDLVPPTEAYSAARYQRGARTHIERLRREGRVPVLCGGTGLYIDAALDDLRFPSGTVEDGRRRRLEALAGELGAEGLHAYLAARDSRAADLIHPRNVRRTIRALEMWEEGTSYADQSRSATAHTSRYPPTFRFALARERGELYHRIDERVDAMMREGFLDEVGRLRQEGAGAALTSRQAIGYEELLAVLDGRLALPEAVERIKQRSRRYAKRQLSWLRRDGRTRWIDLDETGIDGAVGAILDAVHAEG